MDARPQVRVERVPLPHLEGEGGGGRVVRFVGAPRHLDLYRSLSETSTVHV